MINRLADRWVSFGFHREKTPVDWRNMTALAAGVVGIVVGDFGEHHWGFTGWLLALIPGALAGVGVFYVSGIPRKLTWQRGYRDGRNTWLTSLSEAHRRGLHPVEWLAGEMERDGLPAQVIYDGATEAPIGLEMYLPPNYQPKPKEDR